MPKTPAHRARRKPPFFRPVPLRARAGGWTVQRQCAFLVQLYLTGSVTSAARAVGVSRASAYRLRERADGAGFAHAWGSVFMPPGSGKLAAPESDWRKVTNPTLLGHMETGLVQPVIYRGQFTAIRVKRDNSALFRMLRRFDAAERATQSKGATV